MSALATESNFSYGSDLSASVKVRDTVNRLINRKNDKRPLVIACMFFRFILSSTKFWRGISCLPFCIYTFWKVLLIISYFPKYHEHRIFKFITNITGKERSKKKKNKLEKAIKENNENNQKVIQKLENIENLVKGLQKSEVDISKIKYSEWEKIRMSTGLKFEAIDLKLKQETKNNAFQWDDRTEREKKDSIRDDTLPIKLVGTTDAAVVDRLSISSRIPQHHIRILFELKKSISDGNLYQALAELTAGDLKSIHAVLAVLTDLRDDWQFFYFDDEIIGTFTLPRSKAVALIQINMKSADQELNDEIEVMEPLPKRQKLKHVMNIRYMKSEVFSAISSSQNLETS
uniref:Crinkler family protein n=1 Tax=Rhizophagus irregularis (strain DAOM 181602 / DAOM 197198 / MUCL 43194) TaxID=747089 RepID=U9U941_RHIID